MKKILPIVFMSLIVAIILSNLSFFPASTQYQKANNNFKEAIANTDTIFYTLAENAKQFRNGKLSLDSLKASVSKAREAYKKVEFYIAFHHHDYANKHLNGAPLLQIEKSGALPDVVPPEGLQTIDELVYTDELENDKTRLISLTQKLYNHYHLLSASINKTAFNVTDEIIAMRMQLVRIFTLGITGFDTPGSLNGIQESAVSLAAMHTYLQNFKTQNTNNKQQLNSIRKSMQQAIAYLNEHETFEDFDRLVFLTDYLDPLYANLAKIQTNPSEALAQQTAWNPQSTSLFSNDFLNPYYFTSLNQKEDNKALRSLGKRLFYEPMLSNNQKISCASCHQPELAFTDGVAKSKSNLQGKTVLRNAPSLINAVYADRYFYDLRAFTLEQQAEHVIFNDQEFNTAYTAILQKLNQNPTYQKAFKKTFNSLKINRTQFTKALSSYVLSLRSFNSPFDQFVRKEDTKLSQEAKKGFNLFMGKANCATCHFPPSFAGLVPPLYTDSETEILGVLQQPKQLTLDADKGRIDNQIHNEKAWIYERSFKTTSVRNTEQTAPYFHNGAYKTLAEVIDFYNDGGGAGKGLTVTNQTLGADPLNLTANEKSQLIAFMQSLTDTSLNNN